MTIADAICLSAIPTGRVERTHFHATPVEVPAPETGEITIRALWVSVDPYLMMPIRAGTFPDGRIRSRIIARVERSAADGYAAGDLVLGFARWQTRDTVSAREMRKIDPVLPLPAYLGIAGHSGFTAFLGVNILDPQAGQTVTISSAAGMVGMVAAQMSKAAGAKVIAIAGGQKAEAVASMFGLDAAIDHRAPDFVDKLAQACPDGIDLHFENVGAKILDPVLSLANKPSRVALCGLIQHYGDEAPICLANFRQILLKSVQILPFSIYNHEDRYPAALVRLEHMVQLGQLRAPETIHQGLGSIPDAFIAMLSGNGIGKHLVHVAD